MKRFCVKCGAEVEPACPVCRATLARLPVKPRDLGLLLNVLLYRVPIEAETTEEWIETARKHCRMKAERLAELRAGPHARHWRNMAEKRARRLAWMQEQGTPPPWGWTPPATGEPDHEEAVLALRLYWKKVRPVLAKLKRRPEAQGDKITNRYLATRKIRSPSRKLAALNDVEARLVMQWNLERGERVSVRDFLTLRSQMLPDDSLRRFKKKPPAGMDSQAERLGQTAGGEPCGGGFGTPRTARPARREHERRPVTPNAIEES